MNETEIDLIIKKHFIQDHHLSAKDLLLSSERISLPAWTIQNISKRHTCDVNTFGNNRQRWNTGLLSMYNNTFEFPDLCDFQFVHDPTNTVFNVHLAHVFSKCDAIRTQVTSGMINGIRKFHISKEESLDVEALRTVIFFLYTGFLIDLSIVDVNNINESDIHNIELSYDAYQLYKISQILIIPSLTEALVDRCIDIFGPRSDPNDSRLQIASLLVVSQGDSFLFERVLSIVKRIYRTPGILMLYPTLFNRYTWDSVIDSTKELFMTCPGVFILYSLLFGLSMRETSEKINSLRDQLDGFIVLNQSDHSNECNRERLWSMKWIDIINGLDTRICMPDECFDGLLRVHLGLFLGY